MFADAVRELYAYDTWANARVFDAAGQIDRETLLEGADGGYGSIRDTLVHIVDAAWTYLERWRGRSPDVPWDPGEFPDVASIRRRWDDVAAKTAAFIAELSDSDLARVVSYVNVHGETWSYPLWQQLLHQVNHATQHRSEVAARLTQLDHSPGWLDFLIFIDERGDAATG